MSRKNRRVRQLLGYFLVAFAIVGVSFGFKGVEVKCEYLNALRGALLKVERDEIVLNDVQVLLQKIRSIKSDAEWHLEYESVIAELQGFVDYAFFNVYERRHMIDAKIQAALARPFCE